MTEINRDAVQDRIIVRGHRQRSQLHSHPKRRRDLPALLQPHLPNAPAASNGTLP